VVEFQSARRIGPVLKGVSLVRVLLRLRLEVERPGPRLLEPVGTICHLTGQTRPCLIALAKNRGVGKRRQDRSGRGEERSSGSDTVSSLLPHRVQRQNDPV
jgi:hypothetical protein